MKQSGKYKKANNVIKLKGFKENRTYFGDEIEELVNYLIESPYNNWQEEDREYLMGLDNDHLYKIECETAEMEMMERSLYESEIKDERISFFINRILEYEDIVSNSWVPIPWIILYKKVPEGLEVTIDTDEYFDDSKEGSLYHFYEFVKDIFQDYENDDLYDITGFRDEDVEFLHGEKNGHATYLLHASPTLRESSYKNRKSW